MSHSLRKTLMLPVAVFAAALILGVQETVALVLARRRIQRSL